MVSVSTNNYYAMIQVAQIQAARTGLPMDSKQSVPVAVEQQAPPPAPPNPNAPVSQIVDVLV